MTTADLWEQPGTESQILGGEVAIGRVAVNGRLTITFKFAEPGSPVSSPRSAPIAVALAAAALRANDVVLVIVTTVLSRNPPPTVRCR